MDHRGWIEVGRRAVAGETEGLLCPLGDGGELEVTKQAMSGGGAEYRLRCPVCGVENYVRKNGDIDQVEPGNTPESGDA